MLVRSCHPCAQNLLYISCQATLNFHFGYKALHLRLFRIHLALATLTFLLFLKHTMPASARWLFAWVFPHLLFHSPRQLLGYLPTICSQPLNGVYLTTLLVL